MYQFISKKKKISVTKWLLIIKSNSIKLKMFLIIIVTCILKSTFVKCHSEQPYKFHEIKKSNAEHKEWSEMSCWDWTGLLPQASYNDPVTLCIQWLMKTADKKISKLSCEVTVNHIVFYRRISISPEGDSTHRAY